MKGLAITNITGLSGTELENITADACAGTLLKFIPPIEPSTPMIEVLERFVSHSSLHAIPIVKGDYPIGLVNRNTVVELFSKPFTRELYGKQPISQFQSYNPIIVDFNEGIDDLAQIILDAGMQYMYDGFIITEHGKYAGMGTGHDLLNEITKRKQAHLYYLAHYDQLTGLPNRLLLMDRLVHACAQAAREVV